MKFTSHQIEYGLFMMRLKFLVLSLLMAVAPLQSAENIKSVGAVSKANIKAVGAVVEANIKAVGAVDNTAGGGAPTYLLEQNFDTAGVPTDWNNSGANFDYTATVLEGTQSLQTPSGSQAFLNEIFNLTEFWGYWMLRRVSWAGDPATIFAAYSSGYTSELTVDVAADSLRVASGTTESTVTTTADTTTYHVWMHALKGTGANATVEVWFSTTTTKPADASNGHAKITNGSFDANITAMNWCSLFGGTADFIVDKVRIDDVAIGSNPP